jgi:hypothetical protein
VEDEDEQDGEAAEAVEGGIAAGFGGGDFAVGDRRWPSDEVGWTGSRGKSLRGRSEAIWLERRGLGGVRQ